MLRSKKKIHFIGLGGIGMSGIARILNLDGHEISGSDAKESRLINEMRKEGIKCFIGHRGENVGNSDIVVYSSAIDNENSELRAARAKHSQIMHRADMLSKLLSGKNSIAVTGSHGKTTTSALIALIFKEAGMKPAATIGGEVLNFGSNILYGRGDYFITEADESDGSFLRFNPDRAVLLNIDREHLDYFNDIDNAVKIYRRFADNVKARGAVYYNSDDEYLKKALGNCRKKMMTFGIKGEPDVKGFEIRQLGLTVSFRCSVKGVELPDFITFPKPGCHNVTNALAAIAVARDTGIDFKIIKHSIENYKGTKRRFEIKSTTNGIMVVEDYAHHPTEIEAVLRSCEPLKRNLIVIFQPHRYTRTKELFQDFLKCFDAANYLILTDIYAANEKAIDGVTTERLCSEMKRAGSKNVEYIKKGAITERVKDIAMKGDIILVLGAGDVNEVAAELETMFNGARTACLPPACKAATSAIAECESLPAEQAGNSEKVDR
ncbi:MAG: UDP-N-acetylmuramate--L-alanine ligase [Candidatus Omnitrophota bacterium]|nr:UDP-N-acetylmuramate--L-alanine ligase [Candidatus Omnitrophota bacterium]